MTATVFRQSYVTQRPSLFTLISYCAIVFSFALMFTNGWFTTCDGFYGASAYWLSHMKQYETINHYQWPLRSRSSYGFIAYNIHLVTFLLEECIILQKT